MQTSTPPPSFLQGNSDSESVSSSAFSSPAPSINAILAHPVTPPTPPRMLVQPMREVPASLDQLNRVIDEHCGVRDGFVKGRRGEWEVREVLEKLQGDSNNERLKMACLMKENEVIREQLRSLMVQAEQREGRTEWATVNSTR